MVALHGVAQRQIRLHLVGVAPALTGAAQVPGVDELADDALGGALGDPDDRCDVAKAYPRIPRDAEQDVSMVRQERPAGWLGWRRYTYLKT